MLDSGGVVRREITRCGTVAVLRSPSAVALWCFAQPCLLSSSLAAFFLGGHPRLKVEEVVYTPGNRFRLQARRPAFAPARGRRSAVGCHNRRRLSHLGLPPADAFRGAGARAARRCSEGFPKIQRELLRTPEGKPAEQRLMRRGSSPVGQARSLAENERCLQLMASDAVSPSRGVVGRIRAALL